MESCEGEHRNRQNQTLEDQGLDSMGRLMSDILTENGLVAHLTESSQTDELDAIVGRILDGKSLKRMKIIEKLQSDPVQIDSEAVRTRRVRVEDFPLFTAKEPREALFPNIASCQADGTPMPSDLLKRASEPAPEIIEKKRRKKRKATEEGPSKRASKSSKRKGNSSSAHSPVLESIIEPTSQPILSSEPTPSSEPN